MGSRDTSAVCRDTEETKSWFTFLYLNIFKPIILGLFCPRAMRLAYTKNFGMDVASHNRSRIIIIKQ